MPTFLRPGAACLIALLAVAACTPPTAKVTAGASSAPKPKASAAPGVTTTPKPASPGATLRPAAAPPTLLGVGVFGGASVIGQNGATVVGQNGGALGSAPVPGAGIVTDNGAGLVETQLTGVVRAPAWVLSNHVGQIVTDNGAGIVTDNGAGLVSDAGGGIVGSGANNRRLLAALEQLPYAGATVHMLDATGRPVRGADGQPLTAVTDAQGRYALTARLPAAANVVLAAALPADNGQLGAIAPRGAARTADLDLASTWTAGYILTRYVRPQADAQATLDRLTPALEASARGAVAGALEAQVAAGRPVPVALASSVSIEDAVEGLRIAAAPVDAQLEEVRRALLVGLPDLGAGRVATEVALPWIRGVVPAPGGGFYLSAALAGRVMGVGADGRLTTIAGSAAGLDPGSLAGKPAAEAGLGVLQGLLPDADGLLILEQRRLTRRGPDGQLTELWPQGATSLTAVGRAPGGWWLLARDGCWKLATGAAPAKVHDVPDLAFVKRVTAFGQDAQGRLVLLGGNEVRSYDPATGVLTPLAKVDGAGIRGLGVDAAGGLYVQDATGAIRDGVGGAVRIPAAAKVTTSSAAFAAQPDGSVLWALLGQVQRVQGEVKALVAGKTGVSVDADGQLALNRPGGLLVEPDGSLLVAVAGDGQVARVALGAVSIVAGTGATDGAGDGGPATAASIPNPTALRRDAAGNRYVLQAARTIRRIAPDGGISTLYALPAESKDRRLYDFAVTPDGKTLYLTGADTNGQVPALPRAGFVTRLDLASKAETVVIPAEPGPTHVIALDATQQLHVLGGGKLRRWSDAGFADVAADPRLVTATGWTALARAAFDAKGRFWWFTGSTADTLCRLDGSAVTVVAGPGGTFLTGDGVDDSLLNGMAPVFTPEGDVLFCDVSHNQVKRLAGAAR